MRDWQSLIPQIRELGMEGKTLSEIAKLLQVRQPYFSLICRKYKIFASPAEYGKERQRVLTGDPAPAPPAPRRLTRRTWELEIDNIRQLGAKGWTIKQIAAFYGVTQSLITTVCQRYHIFNSRNEYGKGRQRAMLHAEDGLSAHVTIWTGESCKVYNNVTPGQLRELATMLESLPAA